MRWLRAARIRSVPARPDDTGAVAVIAAMAVSMILLVTAAFAVDFGNAFAQRANLQGIADGAARAGAAELPDQNLARAAAVADLCSQPASTGWDFSGCATNPQTAPTLAGSPVASISFTLTGGVATGITVVPAAQFVQFGVGQVVGIDGVPVTAAAQARIATALGVGVLPFPLFQDQLDSTPPGTNGQFCLGPADPPDLPTGTTTRVNGSGGPFDLGYRQPVNNSTSASVVWNSGALIQVRSDNSGPYKTPDLQNVKIFIGGVEVTGVVQSPGSLRRWQFTAPVYKPGVTKLWMTADYLGQPMVSELLNLTYTGTVTNPCGGIAETPASLDIARDPDPGDADRLQDNIAQGLDTALHPWPNWPSPQSSTPLPSAHAECGALPPATVRQTSTTTPDADINCVTVTYGPLPSGTADGLFGAGGRMFNRCGGGTRAAPSPYSGSIDDTRLFAVGSPLLADGVDPTQLKTDLQSGALPPTGTAWLTSRILTCPRLAIVPVVDRDPAVTSGTYDYPVMGYRYIWIDDDTANRGFLWAGTTLVGIRGYIIDPHLITPDGISPVTGNPLVPVTGDTVRTTPFQPENWPLPSGDQPLPKVVVLGPPDP